MDYHKLNHTTWNCKYHIFLIPMICKAFRTFWQSIMNEANRHLNCISVLLESLLHKLSGMSPMQFRCRLAYQALNISTAYPHRFRRSL